MPTFIKSGYWESLDRGYRTYLNLDKLIRDVSSAYPYYSISQNNIDNWNISYSWGDHSLEGYVKTKPSTFSVGGESNYAEFQSDGTLKLYGEATVFKDLLQPLLLQTKNNPSAKLVENVVEGTLDFTDSATTSDYSTMNIQMNHDWKIGSKLFPHIHWFQKENVTPNWLLQWRWQINGSIKATSWTNLPLNDNAFDYVGGTDVGIQITSGDSIVPPVEAKLSDILQIRIMRDTANASSEFSGLDTYTGNAEAINMDIHYEIDSLGSKEEYVK